jgi:hypothetical protein
MTDRGQPSCSYWDGVQSQSPPILLDPLPNTPLSLPSALTPEQHNMLFAGPSWLSLSCVLLVRSVVWATQWVFLGLKGGFPTSEADNMSFDDSKLYWSPRSVIKLALLWLFNSVTLEFWSFPSNGFLVSRNHLLLLVSHLIFDLGAKVRTPFTFLSVLRFFGWPLLGSSRTNSLSSLSRLCHPETPEFFIAYSP